MTPEQQKAIFEDFPALRILPFTVTGPASEDYNCFAHAVGRDDVWAWPEKSSHWLAGVPRDDTVESVVVGLGLFGYQVCETGDCEAGFEKVCVYALEDDPRHVSRQLPSGEWTSKLGRGVVITHVLAGLEGDCYGRPVMVMKRSRSGPAHPSPPWEPPTAV
jgi:hypothetical protein